MKSAHSDSSDGNPITPHFSPFRLAEALLRLFSDFREPSCSYCTFKNILPSSSVAVYKLIVSCTQSPFLIWSIHQCLSLISYSPSFKSSFPPLYSHLTYCVWLFISAVADRKSRWLQSKRGMMKGSWGRKMVKNVKG